jgi:hypothetical protein
MAAIVAATMLGLVYLTQTLGSNATSSEIRSLAADGDDVARHINNHALSVQVNSDPEEIIKRATALGLKRLDVPVVLTVP